MTTDTPITEMPLSEALAKADGYQGDAGKGVPSVSRTLADAVRQLERERNELQQLLIVLVAECAKWRADLNEQSGCGDVANSAGPVESEARNCLAQLKTVSA